MISDPIEIGPMKVLSAALGDFSKSWRQMMATGVICKTISFFILTPLVGLALTFFISTKGSAVIADQDILFFILSPIGLTTLVLIGTVNLTILALQQACLMAIGVGEFQSRSITTVDALRFGVRQAVSVGKLALRVLVPVLLMAAPFLAAGALIGMALLRKHDINFYLTTRPPVFLLAAGVVGLLVAIMAILITLRLLSWIFALPLVLFENLAPADALTKSSRRSEGHKMTIGFTLVVWAVAAILVSTLSFTIVGTVAHWTVPLFADSMVSLQLVVGIFLVCWFSLNLALTLVNESLLASIVVRHFVNLGRSNETEIPVLRTGEHSEPFLRGPVAAKWAFTGLLAAGAVAAGAGALLMNTVRFDDEIVVIAHRGAAGTAPENTLASVESAIRSGTDMVEIDVQESADGRVVVIHDRDLMRVGSDPRNIWESTYADILEIDVGRWFGPGFNGERVPTLEQVLAACNGRAKVIIELKYYGHNVRLEERVAEIVEAQDMETEIVLMSLVPNLVSSMKALRPHWSTGLLTAKAIGNLTTSNADFLAVHFQMATPAFVRRAHASGKEVFVWTVNDRLNMHRMISKGVDGIITDYPSLARSVVAERSNLNPAERFMLAAAFWMGLEPKEPPAKKDLESRSRSEIQTSR